MLHTVVGFPNEVGVETMSVACMIDPFYYGPICIMAVSYYTNVSIPVDGMMRESTCCDG